MSTATTKRYVLCKEEDTSYKPDDDHHMRRMRIYVWDSIDKKEIRVPRYKQDQIPTISALTDLLQDFCQEMNDKHEDDLLYLKIVKDYTEDEQTTL